MNPSVEVLCNEFNRFLQVFKRSLSAGYQKALRDCFAHLVRFAFKEELQLANLSRLDQFLSNTERVKSYLIHLYGRVNLLDHIKSKCLVALRYTMIWRQPFLDDTGASLTLEHHIKTLWDANAEAKKEELYITAVRWNLAVGRAAKETDAAEKTGCLGKLSYAHCLQYVVVKTLTLQPHISLSAMENISVDVWVNKVSRTGFVTDPYNQPVTIQADVIQLWNRWIHEIRPLFNTLKPDLAPVDYLFKTSNSTGIDVKQILLLFCDRMFGNRRVTVEQIPSIKVEMSKAGLEPTTDDAALEAAAALCSITHIPPEPYKGFSKEEDRYILACGKDRCKTKEPWLQILQRGIANKHLRHDRGLYAIRQRYHRLKSLETIPIPDYQPKPQPQPSTTMVQSWQIIQARSPSALSVPEQEPKPTLSLS